MLNVELATIDFGTLQMLVAVQDSQSFSEASHRLGVNQSTISYAISRLRKAFNDPIFVRQGNAIAATDKCQELVQRARAIIEQMEALSSLSRFDPKTATGTVTVSCNHHERMFLIPDFVRQVQREAPNVQINIFESAVDGKRQLKENICDIVLGPVAILGNIYYRRKLFVDYYACVMDPAHPLGAGPFTLDTYRQCRHVAVTHNGRWEALYIAALGALNCAFTPEVTVPSHDILERMIPGTELISTIPYRLARKLSDKLALRRFPLDVFIHVDMYWTERTHHSGLHRWARQILADVAQRNIGTSEVVDIPEDDPKGRISLLSSLRPA